MELANLSASAVTDKIFTLFVNLRDVQEKNIGKLQASFEDVMWEKFRLWNVVWKNKSAETLHDMQARSDYFRDFPIRFEQEEAEKREARKHAGVTTEEENISYANKKERFVEKTVLENLRQWFDISDPNLTKKELPLAIRRKIEIDAENARKTAFYEQVESSTQQNTSSSN